MLSGFNPGVCTDENCDRYNKPKIFLFYNQDIDEETGIVCNASLKTKCTKCGKREKYVFFPTWWNH